MTCPCFVGWRVGLSMCLLSGLPAGRRKGSFKPVLIERVWMRGDVFVGSKVGATQRKEGNIIVSQASGGLEKNIK